MGAEVGHLTEVKHNDDGLCFVCDGMGGGRAVQAHMSVSKPFIGGLGVSLLLIVFGLCVGFILAVQICLIVWG